MVLSAAAAIGGCTSSYGPKTIPAARFDYNEAISSSWDDQLLLNLVRLRYRDNPLFVDVSSVTAGYALERTGVVGGSVGSDEGAQGTAALGLKLVENPVISYNYLSGEAFNQRLLSPLTPGVFESLAQSGWSIERLLLCCVNGMNGVENAVAAAGPTPDYVPRFESFQRIAAVFRKLQINRHVVLEREGDTTFLYIDSQAGADGDELRSLLLLEPGKERYAVVGGRRARGANEIAVEGRSLLSVMFFLSQSVEVPEADRAAGKVTTTRDTSGTEFDWSRVVGPVMRVQCGEAEPAAGSAAVAVSYRGHWFWIEDSDLNSKTTFALLRLLLFLKSGENKTESPAVTIPMR
jgi:hypothetical protein